MKIVYKERYDRFMDAVKLNLILWRRTEGHDLPEIAQKLGVSERTARRRIKYPETLTLGELFAWCELYGKAPTEMLRQAFSATEREDSAELSESSERLSHR